MPDYTLPRTNKEIQIRPHDDPGDQSEWIASATELRVGEMYLKKVPVTHIARELGITYIDISRILDRFSARWREKAEMDVRARIAEELEQLDRLQAIAEDAWERSVGEVKKTTQKLVPAKIKLVKGDTSFDEEHAPQRVTLGEQTTVTETQVGDSKFLDVILKCIDRRLKLLGLDAPEKLLIAMGNQQTGTITPMEVRIAKYHNVIGVAVKGGASTTDPHLDHPGKSVDSKRSPSKASGVLDVPGRVIVRTN